MDEGDNGDFAEHSVIKTSLIKLGEVVITHSGW